MRQRLLRGVIAVGNFDGNDIRVKLQGLKTLLAGAGEVRQDLETLARTLREQYVDSEAYPLSAVLADNLAALREIFSGSDDIRFREFWAAPLQLKAALVFFEGMVDEATINEHVIEKLTRPCAVPASGPQQPGLADTVRHNLLTTASVAVEDRMEAIVNQILAGNAALFVDTLAAAIIVSTRKVEARAIAEPETEAEIRGPRDGFTEELRVSITLIRRRVKNPNLVVSKRTVGGRSRTDIAIVYFRGIADFKLVGEVEKRLEKITIDIPAPSGIHGLFEDSPFSIFPTVLDTERPDKVVSMLAEGKVCILIDGTPFCCVVPATFADFFKAGDDYYEKWLPAALIRVTRYIAAFFATTMPALYVAITSFHPGLLPMPLTLTVGASREGVPFPTFIEAFIRLDGYPRCNSW